MMLTIRREKKKDHEAFILAGELAEGAGEQLSGLYRGTDRHCRFNLKDVRLVNSTGIRAWMLFLRDFQQGRVIHIEECSPAIVDQMNMLPSFFHGATVCSIYLPHVCPSCGANEMMLVMADEFEAGKNGSRVSHCSRCLAPNGPAEGPDSFVFAVDRAS